MSYQPQFPDMDAATPVSAPVQVEMALPAPRPATEKQIAYAQALAVRTGVRLPKGIAADRARLSAWIDAQKDAAPLQFAAYPSSKQVAFAERIARLKRRQVPPECFRDRALMSRWIDGNKPR